MIPVFSLLTTFSLALIQFQLLTFHLKQSVGKDNSMADAITKVLIMHNYLTVHVSSWLVSELLIKTP